MDLSKEIDYDLITGAVKKLNGEEGEKEDNPFDDEDVRNDFLRKVFLIVTGIYTIKTLVTALCCINVIALWTAMILKWMFIVSPIVIIAAIIASYFFASKLKDKPVVNYFLAVVTIFGALFFAAVPAIFRYNKITNSTQTKSSQDDTTDINTDYIFIFYALVIITCGTIVISTYIRKYPIYKYASLTIYATYFICCITLVIILLAGGKVPGLLLFIIISLLVPVFMLVVCNQILKGNHRHQFSPEDYVFGAISIYLSCGVVMLIVVALLLKRREVQEQVIGSLATCC